MSDRLTPAPPEALLRWILAEWPRGTLFGYPRDLFYRPPRTHILRCSTYGRPLDTPLGVAAGPQTQLTQNILLAWLFGARTLELKTVQTLDELDVAKPCIDMADEGYNCEWSQELRLTESFRSYLEAWVLLHILEDLILPEGSPRGRWNFNLSVGYDFAGIQRPNVQDFLDRMTDATEELDRLRDRLAPLYPRLRDLDISPCLSDNLTLSTMHGCPPDEIETITRYFLTERHFHTAVKLNPTLLGPERVRTLLNEDLGFTEIEVPEEAFAHDLTWQEARPMIERLQTLAEREGLEFGLKLTNTLEVKNHRTFFPASEEHMYLSGRPLHPLAVNLAAALQREFDGRLRISFSAGADYGNVADLIRCGFMPVTVCSDLLKPGGYSRLKQMVTTLEAEGKRQDWTSLEDWRARRTPDELVSALESYAKTTRSHPRYRKDPRPYTSIKTPRPLTVVDCVSAPCVAACDTDQAIPDYLYYTARGEEQRALEVVLDTNPLPGITGHVCDHLCQLKCTRNALDTPILIREIKRYLAEREDLDLPAPPASRGSVAVIGAGPCGLAAAYYLRRAGLKVDVYEQRGEAGGMVTRGIPLFRLSPSAVDRDLQRLQRLGIRFHLNTPVDERRFRELLKERDGVVLALGAQRMKRLGIPGEDRPGVWDPLDLLHQARQGHPLKLGRRVAVVGGGNTAMDAVRTARRQPDTQEVTLIYRRRRADMPADFEEVAAAAAEGVQIREQLQPVKIRAGSDGALILTLQELRPGDPDASGRPRPVPVPGAIQTLTVDSLIPAIGQEVAADFLPRGALTLRDNRGRTDLDRVYAGGDLIRGAATVIHALGDGRRLAGALLEDLGLPFPTAAPREQKWASSADAQRKLRRRQPGPEPPPGTGRDRFHLVHRTLTAEEARTEAERCLYCDEVCNLCVSVCPNLANLALPTDPFDEPVLTLTPAGDSYRTATVGRFRVRQPSQIINLAEWCNECGNCTTFCPTAGDPYRVKPHLYLHRESWEAEREGLLWEDGCLRLWQDGDLHSLRRSGEMWHYTSSRGEVTFSLRPLRVAAVHFTGTDSLSLAPALTLAFWYFPLHSHPLLQDTP